jgi:hypothetical protein
LTGGLDASPDAMHVVFAASGNFSGNIEAGERMLHTGILNVDGLVVRL